MPHTRLESAILREPHSCQGRGPSMARPGSARSGQTRMAPQDRVGMPCGAQGYRIWCLFLSSFPRKWESMAAANAVEGWIPAFAGMTEVRNLRLLRHMRSPYGIAQLAAEAPAGIGEHDWGRHDRRVSRRAPPDGRRRARPG